MRRYILVVLTFVLLGKTAVQTSYAATSNPIDSTCCSTLDVPSMMDDPQISDDSIYAKPQKPHILAAVLENLGVNVAVYSADRWILKREYCIEDFSFIKTNLRRGFKFDTDHFETNFAGHPYHGAIYYTAARSNNLPVWASSLSALAGCLFWEEFTETDYPSINDVFSTTIGGIALGEMMTKMAKLPLNDKKRGFNRLGREFFSAVLNPMSGLNRIIYGDAWKVKDQEYLYHDREAIPYKIDLSLGYSHFRGKGNSASNEAFLSLESDYGHDTETDGSFYDKFRMGIFLTLPHKRALINELTVNGRMIGWQILNKPKTEALFSFNLDFSYYNYEKEYAIKGNRSSLLRFNESAAMGPAFTWQHFGNLQFKQQLQSNLVMMGAYTSDYCNRDYNMGSGYNIKLLNELSYKDRFCFSLDFGHHYLFVWKGYEDYQLEKKPDLKKFSLKTGRSGGEKGHCTFLIIRPTLDIKCTGNIHFKASLNYFLRKSVYKYQENVDSYYYDLRLGLSYRL